MADAVELATGYVSLSVSTQGMGRQIAQGFKSAGTEADKAGKSSGKRFSAGFGAAAKVGVLAVAAAGFAAAKGLGSTIKAAGDLEQSVGGVKAVFKGYAKSIEASSKRAALAVGLSRNEYNQLAATLGSTLKNKGVKDFGKQTQKLIVLGADLASMFGGTSKEAVEALSSALRGETDPIERYGVSMNQAAIEAEAMRMGLVKTAKDQSKITASQLRAEVAQRRYNKAVKEHGKNSTEAKTAQAGMVAAQAALKKAMGGSKVDLNDQQKAMAALSLITRQTADAQGNFAKESDTLQGKQQRAAAQWENLKAKIGSVFLPVATRAMAFISDKMIPAISRIASELQTRFGPALAQAKTVLAGVASSPAAGWLQTKLIPAVMGLVGAGQRLGAVVLPILQQVAAAFLREWPKIQPVVAGIFSTIGGIVTDVMALIQFRIKVVTAVIKFIWDRWGKQITTIVLSMWKTVVSVFGGALKIIGGLVKVVTGVMTGDWRKAGAGIKLIVSGLKQVLVAIFTNIKTQVQTIIGGLLTAIVNRWKGHLSWVGSSLRLGLARVRDFVLNPIRAARDSIKGILDQMAGRFSAGVSAIARAWDGLKEKAKAPVRFVVNTVLNGGLIAAFNKIARAVGVGTLPNVSAGFHEGGYTGKLDPRRIAGVVHGDEQVIRSSSRRKIERNHPGWLEYMNQTGRIPGYFTGGVVGGSGRFTSTFYQRLLLASKMAGQTINAFQRGFRPATSYSGTSHAGDAIDLQVSQRLLVALRKVGIAAWDRTGKGNWAPHIHGVPLPGAGSAGGSGIWQAQDYLRGGDGLGGRDNGPRTGVLGKLGEFLKAGFDSFTAWFGSLIKDPLAKLRGITGSPFGNLAAAGGRLLVEGLRKKVSVFDTGGYLQPGLSLAYNGTGAPERILTRQEDAGRGTVIHQTFPASMDPMVAAAMAGGRVVASLRARGVG